MQEFLRNVGLAIFYLLQFVFQFRSKAETGKIIEVINTSKNQFCQPPIDESVNCSREKSYPSRSSDLRWRKTNNDYFLK